MGTLDSTLNQRLSKRYCMLFDRMTKYSPDLCCKEKQDGITDDELINDEWSCETVANVGKVEKLSLTQFEYKH